MRNEEASDENAFKKLLAEIERLSCLANNANQTDDRICDVLLKAVEEEPWALHAQTKDGIELIFSKDFEGLLDSIEKYNTFNKKKQFSTSYPLRGRHKTRL